MAHRSMYRKANRNAATKRISNGKFGRIGPPTSLPGSNSYPLVASKIFVSATGVTYLPFSSLMDRGLSLKPV